MPLPDQVLEVKEEMVQTNDERLSILRMLTESENDDNKEECKKVWELLFKEHESFANVGTNLWVYSFLDAVIELKELPERFYMSGTDRKQAIKKIKNYTKKLKGLYVSLGLDDNLISNDGQFFHGFRSIDNNGDSKVSVSEVLDFFADYGQEELKEASYRGKKSDKIKAIRFARLLAERNMHRYGKQLEEVIENTILLIYGVRYSEHKEFLTMLNRYKKPEKLRRAI